MVIAVNTRFLVPEQLEGCFTRELFRVLAGRHPEHRFYFLFDRPADPSIDFGPNVTPVVVPPKAAHPLLWKYWFDVKVPFQLKRIGADVFVSPDGFCSLTTRLPQCLLLPDLGFRHQPQDYPGSELLFYRRYIPRFLKKARTVVLPSEALRSEIMDAYPVSADKVQVVYGAPRRQFRPASQDEAIAIKEKWTGGGEYFLYMGAIHPRRNLIHLLKAFSLFKKRLRSGMKLVLVGPDAWKNDGFGKLLASYKYREDVVLTGHLQEVEAAQLVGGAYALVDPAPFEGFGLSVLEAMASDVPALAPAGNAVQELAGEAALYFDPADPASMAEALMRIYKDERLYADLVAKGREASARYSWERTADLIWEQIVKAMEWEPRRHKDTKLR